ncbi:MAG: hypothetical protein R3F31_25435 [Verrucomicrobiales bacterium]
MLRRKVTSFAQSNDSRRLCKPPGGGRYLAHLPADPGRSLGCGGFVSRTLWPKPPREREIARQNLPIENGDRLAENICPIPRASRLDDQWRLLNCRNRVADTLERLAPDRREEALQWRRRAMELGLSLEREKPLAPSLSISLLNTITTLSDRQSKLAEERSKGRNTTVLPCSRAL